MCCTVLQMYQIHAVRGSLQTTLLNVKHTYVRHIKYTEDMIYMS